MKYEIDYREITTGYSHVMCDYHGGQWESALMLKDKLGNEIASVKIYAERRIHSSVLQSLKRHIFDLVSAANNPPSDTLDHVTD